MTTPAATRSTASQIAQAVSSSRAPDTRAPSTSTSPAPSQAGDRMDDVGIHPSPCLKAANEAAGSDDPVAPEHLELRAAVAQQLSVDLRVVLAEERRARELGGRVRQAHGIRGHRVGAA